MDLGATSSYCEILVKQLVEWRGEYLQTAIRDWNGSMDEMMSQSSPW